MSEIAKAVAVIGKEFQAREAEISEQLAEIKEQKSKSIKKSRELTAREKEIGVKEGEIKKKEAYIAGIDSVEVMRADAAAELKSSAEMLERAKKLNKESEIFNGEAKQKLAEQAKREIALNDEKATYKKKIREEVIAKALNLK